MTWAKLDDGFWMHPKVLGVGNAAAGVFARMLSYCGCYLTDGLVPEPIASTIQGTDAGSLEALEKANFLVRLETGSYWISDYLEFNPSKEQVTEAQKQRRDAGRKGGLKSRPPKPDLKAVGS